MARRRPCPICGATSGLLRLWNGGVMCEDAEACLERALDRKESA